MIVDVIHPARPNVSKSELQEKLGELYKSPKEHVFVFGMRTHYGGGRSTGFALIYDSKEALEKFEPTHRLVRVCISDLSLIQQNGLAPKIEKPSRKLRKERKKYVLHALLGATIQPPCQEGPWHQEGQGHRGEEEVKGLAYPPVLSQLWLCISLGATVALWSSCYSAGTKRLVSRDAVTFCISILPQ